ncbi:hypothetical protein D3C73_885190 [compost metagenome]
MNRIVTLIHPCWHCEGHRWRADRNVNPGIFRVVLAALEHAERKLDSFILRIFGIIPVAVPGDIKMLAALCKMDGEGPVQNQHRPGVIRHHPLVERPVVVGKQ